MTSADFDQELANALQSAQPKIQKMCEEESDDQEAVAKLFEINDSIHRTIERYKLIKKGDVDGASKIPQGTLGTSTGVSKTADNELSLIGFGGDPEPNASTSGNANGPSQQQGASVQDDLLGLSIQDQDYGQGGGIALGFGANSSKQCPLSNVEKHTDLIPKTSPDHRSYHQLRRTVPQSLHPRLQHLNHSKLLCLPNLIMTPSDSCQPLSLRHGRVHLRQPPFSKHSKLQDLHNPLKTPLIPLLHYHQPLHVQHRHSPIHNHFKNQPLHRPRPCSTLRLRNLQLLKVSLPRLLNKRPMVPQPTMTGILPQPCLTTALSSQLIIT